MSKAPLVQNQIKSYRRSARDKCCNIRVNVKSAALKRRSKLMTKSLPNGLIRRASNQKSARKKSKTRPILLEIVVQNML